MTTETKLNKSTSKFVKGMCDRVRRMLTNSTIDVEPYDTAEFRLMNIQDAIKTLQSVESKLISHIEAQKVVTRMTGK